MSLNDVPLFLVLDVLADLVSKTIVLKLSTKLNAKSNALFEVEIVHVAENFVIKTFLYTHSNLLQCQLVQVLLLFGYFLILKNAV